jgi:hypothetical protein
MQCCSRDQRKQASATTSTHTSPHLNSCSQEVRLHGICHTTFSKAARMPTNVAMVLPRFPHTKWFDWLRRRCNWYEDATGVGAQLECDCAPIKPTATCMNPE